VNPAAPDHTAGAVVVSVGSGKGGVGKSAVACNLAVLLARRGARVVVVDLDTGGANQHLLFGVPRPARTLADFLDRLEPRIDRCVVPVDGIDGLRLLAGAGDTLATANLSFPRKRRLVRHLAALDADVVILDVGAGVGFNALDFFLAGDIHLTVTTPDPPSILDMYRFVKLAAARRVLTSVRPRSLVAHTVSEHDFSRMEDLIEAVARHTATGREQAQRALAGLRPRLVVNRAGARSLNTRLVREMVGRYIGTQMQVLGEIPEDEAVGRSFAGLQPLVLATPGAPAALALDGIATALGPDLGAPRGTETQPSA